MKNVALLLLFISTSCLGQSDTILQKALTVAYASQVIPSSGITYSVYQAEVLLKKNHWVILPSLSMKKLHGMNGYQGGVDLYKKWSKGYGHLGVFYSPDVIYPTYIFKGNIFQKLRKSFEFQLGANAIIFSENSLYSINGGISYYRKKYMFHYAVQHYIRSNSSQRLFVRKYLRNNNDFLQFAYYYGLQEELIIGQINPINIHTFQCGFQKTIFQKTQFQFSVATLAAIYKMDRKEQYFTYRIALKRRL